MNFYPTRYSELSNNDVNELYRSENWANLSHDERLDALQELENRSAEACGNEPCQVRLEEMNGFQYGGYANGEIVLNEHLVSDGRFVTQYADGSVDTVEVGGINAQMMDTIHHENYHAYQDEVIHGNIEHSDAYEAELWKANWPNEQYIGCDDPSGCYRIQSIEKSAFEHGETETKAAFSEIESQYGFDEGYQHYLEEIEANSYNNALENAKWINGDSNIEETVNNRMLDAYHDSQEIASSYMDEHSDSMSESDNTASAEFQESDAIENGL